MRLFIADDSELLRGRLVTVLSEIEGIKIVGQEGNVRAVLEAVDRLKPDLITMDIKMPGGNGIEALAALKKRKDPPVVIMFTNYPYREYREKCMKLGADFFFCKCTEFEKLVGVMKKLVQDFPSKQGKKV